MSIRPLTASDYDALLTQIKELDQIHADSRPDYFLPRENPFPRDVYLESITAEDYLILGAFREDGAMDGFAMAALKPDSGLIKGMKTLLLDNLYVRTEARRQGIAASLMDAVTRWGREQGAKRMDLHVWAFNEKALAFYRAMGLTPQRYVMEKKL